jgi:hypothetical protein
MKGPYRPAEPRKPASRLPAIVLGVVVTAALLAALIWSITQWPHTCAKRLRLPADAISD